MREAGLYVVAGDTDGKRTLLDFHPLVHDRAVTVGREGEVGVAIDPVDPKVSRHALTITRTGDRWQVQVTNRNGADLQLWGQPSMPCRGEETVSWPRIAVRVRGSRGLQHWVLLEDPGLTRTGVPVEAHTQLTESLRAPAPLTAAQQEALRSVFADLLAWPPRFPAQPLALKQVAKPLGRSREAVQRRLEEARRKALDLGLGRIGLLTDPEYLYVLVRAGYLQPSDDDLHPPLI